jgi:hypothetical protein
MNANAGLKKMWNREDVAYYSNILFWYLPERFRKPGKSPHYGKFYMEPYELT